MTQLLLAAELAMLAELMYRLEKHQNSPWISQCWSWHFHPVFERPDWMETGSGYVAVLALKALLLAASAQQEKPLAAAALPEAYYASYRVVKPQLNSWWLVHELWDPQSPHSQPALVLLHCVKLPQPGH